MILFLTLAWGLQPLFSADPFVVKPYLQLGVLYVNSGAGGAPLHDSKQTGQPETWLPFTERLVADRHSFTVLDIAGGRLTLRQIDSNAKLIDRIEVTK